MRGKAGLKTEKSAKLLCHLRSGGDCRHFWLVFDINNNIRKKEEIAQKLHKVLTINLLCGCFLKLLRIEFLVHSTGSQQAFMGTHLLNYPIG